MPPTPQSSLHHQLTLKADPKTKAWWENYVKDSAPFLGVKMADVRAIVHRWHAEEVAGRLDADAQLDLALTLFAGETTEDKLAGTLFLQEILLPAGALRCECDLERLAGLFTAGYIYDWNVCDWFCIKVLGPLIKEEGEDCARRIAAWHTADNLWQARASLVAFVPVAGEAAFYPLVETACATLIRRPERFAKTAVGWILHDISKQDEAFVERVVAAHLPHFSPEALKNALKYFDPAVRKAYVRRLKAAGSAAAG